MLSCLYAMNNMGQIPVEQWAPPWTQLKVFGNKDNFGMDCSVPECRFDRSIDKSKVDNVPNRSNEAYVNSSQCKTLSPCSDKSGFEAEVICMSPNSDKVGSKNENYSSVVGNISFDEVVKSVCSVNQCPQEFPLDLLGNILPDMSIKEEPIAALDVGQPSSDLSSSEWRNNTTPAHFDALKVVSEHLVERIKLEDVCQNGPGYPFCFGQPPAGTSFKHPFGIASQYQVNNFPPYATESNPPTIICTSNGSNHKDTANNSFNISMNNNLMCTTMFLMNESLQQNGPHQAHNAVRKHHDIFNIACEKGCNCEAANSFFRAGNSLMFSPDKHPGTSKHFMSPCGPLQLTAQECGELLLKKVSTAGSIVGTEQTNISTGSQNSGESSNAQRKSRPPGSNVTVVHQGTLTENGVKILPMPGQKYRVAKERPFSCTECGKSFLLKHHLVTHARVHTGERPHVCPECGKSFAHKHCLSTHLLLHSSDRPYKCMECKKSFTLKHHLVTHARVHSRDRPFVCQECGRTFPQKRHLVTHGKFHSGERPFVCEECGESFAQKDHLVMHSRFHGAQRAFVCPDCGSTFARKFELVNHGRLHGRLPHTCEICGKEFLQKRTLLAHARLHIEGDRPFVCQHCGEHFARKSELTEHSSIHTEETKFVCRECGNCFPNREGLALHYRLHASDRNFVADLCDLATAFQQPTAHFLCQQQPQQALPGGKVLGGPSTSAAGPGPKPKPHICPDCGKGFAQKHGLAQHNRRHLGGGCDIRQHICNKCGKAFFQKNHLVLHERQHMETLRQPAPTSLVESKNFEVPIESKNFEVPTSTSAE